MNEELYNEKIHTIFLYIYIMLYNVEVLSVENNNNTNNSGMVMVILRFYHKKHINIIIK